MEDGILIRVTTILVDRSRSRKDDFAGACSDEGLAAELFRAERPLTGDQVLDVTGCCPGDLMLAIGMEADEVGCLGSVCID